jgi:hypothetical protein
MEANSGAEVQPEGQGPESTDSSGLEDFYDLSSVPEDQRQYIEPILKEAQTNFNKKVEQVNSQWKPYQDLGVNEIDPDLMEQLVSIAQIADDDEQLKEWWNGLGQERGWANQEVPNEVDEGDFEDDDEITPEDLEQFQQAIQDAIDQRTAPLFEREAQREQEQLVAEADKTIGKQLDALKEQYGEFNEKAVCKLALGYDSEDAIQKGFEEYKNLIQSAENGVFEREAPATPEGPGSADTSAKRITSFADAKAAATERMRQANK